MVSPSARLLPLLRIAFWGALAFALFMALDPKPPRIGPQQLWDKWYHMTAFVTLALLGGLAFPRLKLLRLGEHLSFIGALIEVLQATPIIHRDCDIFDWIADTAAIAVGLLFIKLVRQALDRPSDHAGDMKDQQPDQAAHDQSPIEIGRPQHRDFH